MIWVAVDRGARLARRQGEDELAERWTGVAEQVREEVLERGVRDGVFRQHYETDALDASTLLIPLLRFLPPDDERVRRTVMAIAKDLTRDGLVLRYLVEETDDGLHGQEASFTICSFWLASALSEIGEREPEPGTVRGAPSRPGRVKLRDSSLRRRTTRGTGRLGTAFSRAFTTC